jgi:homoaconitase/3-isopropylmalate dehydratase large subunit
MSDALQLTKTEKRALIGLQARDRVILLDHVQPLQQEYQETCHEIEERLELPKGSLGTTHVVDVDSGTVVPRGPVLAEDSHSRDAKTPHNDISEIVRAEVPATHDASSSS